jgi:hypothetical protein
LADAIDPKTDIYLLQRVDILLCNEVTVSSEMTNASSDAPRSFRRKPVKISLEAVAKAARVARAAIRTTAVCRVSL